MYYEVRLSGLKIRLSSIKIVIFSTLPLIESCKFFN